jgi:hypothetical protein
MSGIIDGKFPGAHQSVNGRWLPESAKVDISQTNAFDILNAMLRHGERLHGAINPVPPSTAVESLSDENAFGRFVKRAKGHRAVFYGIRSGGCVAQICPPVGVTTWQSMPARH